MRQLANVLIDFERRMMCLFWLNSLQTQLRNAKDEAMRWRDAADAAERDLEARNSVLEANELQLNLLDQDLKVFHDMHSECV